MKWLFLGYRMIFTLDFFLFAHSLTALYQRFYNNCQLFGNFKGDQSMTNGGKMSKNFKYLKATSEHMKIPLMDLVYIFCEEAEKVCFSENEAESLVNAALKDFLKQYSKNTIID